MVLRCLIAGFILFSSVSGIFAQGSDEVEELYKDANAYFYFEDYEEALALYLNIYHYYPENSNLDYRIGFCYLNISGSREKSIPYLERATQNLTKRYRENSIKETGAPIEALFYLGNAYYVNGQLSKAEQAYTSFRNQMRSERLYDMEYFNHQLEGIQRSRNLRRFPVNFIRSNLGSSINNRYANFNPVVSGDGSTLAYTTQEPFYQAIYVAKKQGDTWGNPKNITLDLVVDGNCKTLSLSYNGDELYLFKDDNHDGNIYVTNFQGDKWSPMRKLNENINTEYYETHACISPDGKKLYFTSNREGGYGDLDIYVSERDVNGEWGVPENLGPTINTPFNENTPFITTDEETLFFSSEGHSSMGRYDIFFSQRNSNGGWSKPINLGYPINTTDDELFFHPLDDGSVGLMAVFDSKGYGDRDITKIEIFLPKYQRSIISSTDFFEKKDNLPSSTLVVDTVNVAGVALLDPTVPENMKYLDSDNEYTVFFEGSPFEIRNYSKITEVLSAKLSTQIEPESLSISTPNIKPSDVPSEEHADDQLEDSVSHNILAHQNQADSTSSPEEDVSLSDDKDSIGHLTDTSSLSPKLDKRKRKMDDATRGLLDKLKLLADNGDKKDIEKLMDFSWNVSSGLLKLQSRQLSEQFDNENKLDDFTDVFTRFLDNVNSISTKRSISKSRQISKSSSAEDFFFRVQSFKRNASDDLANLIDDAIISQPSITSFNELWDFLRNQRANQFLMLQQEFLSLVIENSVEDYFSLSDEDKEELRNDLASKSILSGWIIALSAVGILIIIVLLLYFKRRNQAK